MGHLFAAPWILGFRLAPGADAVFVVRQFYRGIPAELSESARLNGAGEFRIWRQIIMPLALEPSGLIGAVTPSV